MNRKIWLGTFTFLGILIIVGFSFYINDQPFWYLPCNEVVIQVDDATGLREKSQVKTLGLSIGYIKSVQLSGEKVKINICITAPVQLKNTSRAYVRASGFLGERFLEIKPVSVEGEEEQKQELKQSEESGFSIEIPPGRYGALLRLWGWLIPQAMAQNTSTLRAPKMENGKAVLKASRDVEISDAVKKTNKLLDEITALVKDLRRVTSRSDLEQIVLNLNRSMENLSKLLGPEGALSQSAQRSLLSFERTMLMVEQIIQKVESGEGTIGRILSDDELYEEVKAVLVNLNLLLGKGGKLELFVDMSTWKVNAYDGSRSRFLLNIQPNSGRYYLAGVSRDPFGQETHTVTTTIKDGVTSIEDKVVNEKDGLKITAMFGKHFGPIDLRVGLSDDVATIGAGYWFDKERLYGIHAEAYKKTDSWGQRIYARGRLFMGIYVTGGLEDIRNHKGKKPYFFGIGLYFKDQDIKYLLTLR